jgi:MFS family permease
MDNQQTETYLLKRKSGDSKDTLPDTSKSFIEMLKPKVYEDGQVDQGYAWVTVLASFIVHFFAIGVTYVFGIYQEAYKQDPQLKDIPNFGISFIGSLTSAGLPIFSIISGNLTEIYGHRLIGVIGGVLYFLAFTLASFATQYWQLLLTQGFMLGMGICFSYFPAITILSQWFDKKKGIATGIAVAGSGLGGLVLGPMTTTLISSLGRSKSLLISGVLGGTMIILSALTFRPRLPISYAQKEYFSIFKNKHFRTLYVLSFITTFGYLIPFFYLPVYGVAKGLTANQGALVIGLLNGASGIGRIILGHSADRMGHLNTFTACLGLSSLSIMLIWPFAVNFTSILAFGIVFGLFVGGYISILPTVIVQLFGLENIGGIFGMLYSSPLIGTVFGPSIAGAMIDSLTTVNNGQESTNFVPVIYYSGICMFIGFTLLVKIIFDLRKEKRAEREVV